MLLRFSQYLISLNLRRHTHGPLAKRLMHMVHLSGFSLSWEKRILEKSNNLKT